MMLSQGSITLAHSPSTRTNMTPRICFLSCCLSLSASVPLLPFWRTCRSDKGILRSFPDSYYVVMMITDPGQRSRISTLGPWRSKIAASIRTAHQSVTEAGVSGLVHGQENFCGVPIEWMDSGAQRTFGRYDTRGNEPGRRIATTGRR